VRLSWETGSPRLAHGATKDKNGFLRFERVKKKQGLALSKIIQIPCMRIRSKKSTVSVFALIYRSNDVGLSSQSNMPHVFWASGS